MNLKKMQTTGIIRPIIKKDCPAILNLIHELAVYEKAPNEVILDINQLEATGFGKNPVWWGFVVEEKQVIVGFALYYIRFSTWKGQKMHLEDLYVTAAKRGLGYGKSLFNKLIEEAKSKNLSEICWRVLKWNKAAINFYDTYRAILTDEWYNASIEVELSKNELKK